MASPITDRHIKTYTGHYHQLSASAVAKAYQRMKSEMEKDVFLKMEIELLGSCLVSRTDNHLKGILPRVRG